MNFLEKICSAFEKEGIDYAIVGGYAVALHGAPRGTIDIDLIIGFEKNSFLNAEKVLLTLGLKPRLPINASEVFQFREEYIEKRNLIAWSFYDPLNPINVVDIIITNDLKKCSSVKINFSKTSIKVLSKKDLIKMKLASGRKQDLLDVEALESL